MFRSFLRIIPVRHVLYVERYIKYGRIYRGLYTM